MVGDMRRPLIILVVVASAPLPALAGPVSEVARGVENKQDTHESSNDAAPSDDDDDGGDREVHHDDDDGCSSCGVSVLVSDDDTSGSDTPGSRRTIELEGPTRLDAYLGAHAVVGSDGAGVIDVRVHRDFIGLAVSGVSYFEQVADDKGRMDSVRLDMWAVSLAGRLARAGGTSAWIEGGLGATTSTEYDAIGGLQGGLRVQHEIRPDLELAARARFFGLEHDISAFEAWGGVRAWFLAVGYRSLQFNFGPPLHGPEAGVALSF